MLHIKRILQRLRGAARRPESTEPPPPGLRPAVARGQRPQPLHRGRERIKETYTSHWDLDYLTEDERRELEESLRS